MGPYQNLLSNPRKPHAIFCLKECIDYFTSHGSNVFAAFLDCSKGFDKVNHSGMFIKLMNRGLPLCFLNLLIYWYSNLTSLLKWNGVFSETFRVLQCPSRRSFKSASLCNQHR